MSTPSYKTVHDCSTGETTQVALTSEEIAAMEANVAATDADLSGIRRDRNRYLAECDWTQGADAPLIEAQVASWATYRQELRDFPAGKSKVSEFATDEYHHIIWPTPPS